MTRLPLELSGELPRDVRLSANGIAMVVVAAAMAVGALASAIVMSVAYARDAARQELREREAIAVQAEVVEVTVNRGEHPRRTVTYRFAVDDRTHTSSVRLRERDRREIVRGVLIPIKYVASNPEMSWLPGYEGDRFPLWVIPLVSISLLAGATAVAWGVRREWVLLSEGRVAHALVMKVKRVVRSHGRTRFRVGYEFHELSGARHTGRHQAGKTSPPIGTVIPVVYHRDNPRWNVPYPFQFVRPARAPRPTAGRDVFSLTKVPTER